MEQLGVELILANSPQAKGRVERMNGTLQNRLVKEMRLAGISDLEGANTFLEGMYSEPLDQLRFRDRKFRTAVGLFHPDFIGVSGYICTFYSAKIFPALTRI